METDEIIRSIFEESIEVKSALLHEKDCISCINEIVQSILNSLRSGNKIIFAGNGGSFADSIHLTAEFVSRFMVERDPLAAISLGVNNSILTAVGNDYQYEDVFVREIKALGRKGDVFIGISTSGDSKNIIRTVEAALKMGISVFCLTGKSGGMLSTLCPCLKVPSESTARIQESHITIGHIICEMVERHLYPELFLCKNVNKIRENINHK